jgi:hypothetical protein
MIQFSLLAFSFGLALCVATNSVVVLAAEAEAPWLWWGALLPLAISHATSGFLVICHTIRQHPAILMCAACSGLTTILVVGVAAWAALSIGPWMPTHIALMILVGVSLAGLIGLTLAARLCHCRQQH